MARFEGSMVAIVTPMKDGALDLARYRELVQWHVTEGTDALIPCGTTGEGATLTPAERAEIIRATVEEARELRADAALVVTPYYNKPTQEGLFRHYAAIAEATRFPVIAYNVPSRTSVDLAPDTTARLVKAGAIVGLKDATGNLDRQVQLLERIGREGMAYLSGDDFTAAAYLACGGHGLISVVGNVIPRAVKELVAAARRGDTSGAVDRQVRMAELNRAMFVETNPAPVKAALGLMARCSPELRLPLAPISEASLAKVREAMIRYGVLA